MRHTHAAMLGELMQSAAPQENHAQYVADAKICTTKSKSRKPSSTGTTAHTTCTTRCASAVLRSYGSAPSVAWCMHVTAAPTPLFHRLAAVQSVAMQLAAATLAPVQGTTVCGKIMRDSTHVCVPNSTSVHGGALYV